MKSNLYKDFVVSRGLKYHYYLSRSLNDEKPYMLFLHGFPSSSKNWDRQAAFFELQGYGVIVPDMLGYGGTDKPEEPEAFKSSLITKDLVDILDTEGIGRVFAVGHDWGAQTVGRLANYYQDRFLGFAFYSVGYLPPVSKSYREFSVEAEGALGYNSWGYWSFFSSIDAAQIIKDHIDSFWSLVFTSEPRLWISHVCPEGTLQAYIENDRKTEVFLSPKDYEASKEAFLNTGVASALSWYKIMTSDIDAVDNQDIPESNHKITKPVFFGGATRDYICTPALMRASLFSLSENFTFQDYDSGHWVMIERHNELNNDLLSWIQGILG